MRRAATALAVTTLGLAAALAPSAGADVAPPVPPIRCGTVGPPVCDVLQDLQAQLKPVQPVLALAGPAVGDLGATVRDLLARSRTDEGVSSAQARTAATQLDAALGVLPRPVHDLLGATVLHQLDVTLGQLTAALAPVTEPVLGSPAASEGAKPTVMPSTPTAPAPAPTAANGSDLDGAPLDSGGSATSTGLPDVPDGGVLDLGPLALPGFGWDQEMAEPVAPAPAPAKDDVARFIEASGHQPLGAEGASTGVVVVAFSALLGAAALAAQAWQTRRAAHTIPG